MSAYWLVKRMLKDSLEGLSSIPFIITLTRKPSVVYGKPNAQ